MGEQTLTKGSSGRKTYRNGVPFQLEHKVVISTVNVMHHVGRKKERLP